MKQTFENLPIEKQHRVFNACIREFGEHGYEGSSVDKIIRRAGISKGGIYEYASSKEELFLGTVAYTYTELYSYLKGRTVDEGMELPSDLLERLKFTADVAIDFYLEHPDFVHLIVRTSALNNEILDAQVHDIFRRHFLEFFGDVEISSLVYPKEQILELAMWMLLKTRMDFLMEIKTERDPARIREDYGKNWDFYLEVLRHGIYRN